MKLRQFFTFMRRIDNSFIELKGTSTDGNDGDNDPESVEVDEHFSNLILKEFDKLSLKDKVFVLMSSCHIQDHEERLEIIQKKEDDIIKEIDVFEKENKLEMIRLRSWLIKTLTVGFLIFILIAVFGVLFLGNASQSFNSFMDTMSKIVGLVFK